LSEEFSFPLEPKEAELGSAVSVLLCPFFFKYNEFSNSYIYALHMSFDSFVRPHPTHRPAPLSRAFLEACAPHFDIYIHTKGVREYAENVMRVLDPRQTGMFKVRAATWARGSGWDGRGSGWAVMGWDGMGWLFV
jgi:hypothetical protein